MDKITTGTDMWAPKFYEDPTADGVGQITTASLLCNIKIYVKHSIKHNVKV